MKARLGVLLGGAAVLGAAAYRRFRRPQSPPPLPADDSYAGELRDKLAEARAVVDEREEFEAAETPVDEAEDVLAGDPLDRRRAVHDRARHVAEEMRRGST